LGSALVALLVAGACFPGPEVRVTAQGLRPYVLAQIQIGDSVRLRADYFANELGCDDKRDYSSVSQPRSFQFTSQKPGVGDLRPDGMFVARALGPTTILATSDDGTGSLEVQVVPRIGLQRFVPREATVEVGDTVDLPYSLTDTAGTPLGDGVSVDTQMRDPEVAANLRAVGRSPARAVRVVGRAAGRTWLLASLNLVPVGRHGPMVDSIPLTVVPRR
jgi:hypothetical protein